LLCLLLFSVIFTVPISVVNAGDLCATIWGERTYLKTSDEVHYQDLVAANVTLFFDDTGGYDATNYQKDDATVKSTILAQIGDSEQDYSGAAVVYFDHGMPSNQTGDYNNWHYFVHDNNGDPVYDMDIYDETRGKTFFAFISTCVSANMTFGQGHYSSETAYGMPYAFTRNLVGIDMSDDGYNNAWGGPCYIGFSWGSAALSQAVDDTLSNRKYWMWVYSFFWFALYNDISINSALNQASQMIFNSDFGGTKLHTNFTAIWGELPHYANCNMTVYGNGNIHLKTYVPNYQTLTILPLYWGGYTTPYTGTYYRSQGTYATVTAYPTGGDSSFGNWYLDNEYVGSNNPINVYMDGDHTLQAEFWWSSGPPDNYTLSIEAYVWDFGETYDPVYPNIYIQENQPWFDDFYGTLPVSVTMPGGTYYIEVDQWVWSEYFQQDCRVFFIPLDDQGYGVYFQNYADIGVNANTTVTIFYTIY
jgi:hypothetical protein